MGQLTAPIHQAKTRVVYDSRIFSQQRVGGISRYFAELHRGFRTNSDVESMVAAGAHANRYLDRSVGGLLGARLNHFPGPIHRSIGRINDAAMSRAMRLLNPDIVHYTTYVQPPVPGALTVTTVHDLIHDLFPQYFDTAEYAERQAAAVAVSDGIICISESTRRDMERIYGPTTKPVLVSYHGFAGQVLTAPEATRLAERRRSRSRLLFVGSRSGYKGFDLLLEALGLLEHEPDLVCVGPPFSEAELELARRAGVPRARLSTLAATDNQLLDLYQTVTALVYPSRYEGFGLPVVEAMSQGCPVVCGTSSSLPEVGGGAALYFADYTSTALAETLASLLECEQGVYEANAVDSIDQAQSFTWGSAVERHRRFYRELALG